MLISSTDLTSFPILSLRSSSKIATISKLIINPYDLTIQALKLAGRQLDDPKDSYLLPEDIREISPLGIIINDSEDIVSSTDVIRLQKTLDLQFELIGLPVIDKQQRKVGKVVNYNIIAENMMIYQLVVQRPMFKDFFDPELLIHRSQIAELSHDKVIIKNSLSQLREIERQDAIDNFVNPFRSTKSAKTSK